ncbi:MAG: helix-turn-helix domain-containing protein [Cyanobacteria bacterium P01_A01_bin.83]
MPINHNLGEEKLKAVALLAAGKTKIQTAKELGVHRKTIENWSKSPDFQKALMDTQDEVVEKAIEETSLTISEQVQALLPDAFKVLADVLKNPDSRNADKLKAIQLLGKWSGMEDKKQTEQPHSELEFKMYTQQKAQAINNN